MIVSWRNTERWQLSWVRSHKIWKQAVFWNINLLYTRKITQFGFPFPSQIRFDWMLQADETHLPVTNSYFHHGSNSRYIIFLVFYVICKIPIFEKFGPGVKNCLSWISGYGDNWAKIIGYAPSWLLRHGMDFLAFWMADSYVIFAGLAGRLPIPTHQVGRLTKLMKPYQTFWTITKRQIM